MGCLCSKEAPEDTISNQKERRKEHFNDNSVQLVAPNRGGDGSIQKRPFSLEEGEKKNGVIVGRVKKNTNQKLSSISSMSSADDGSGRGQQKMSRVVSIMHSGGGGERETGWPSWLTSVAGDAIKGWVPRQPESYEKLEKIGQGTYSTVYRARDLQTGKIVAMKKVRFVNMDPESVRFMAREINILRKLDHPNVMKLEALVTSSISNNLYLVFEYMDHDLAGLASRPGVKFTEPQIKCFVKQLLSGLEHCHKRGILHRDIKGSNLLIDDNGVLKIGDFGLATLYDPVKKNPLTSRVVTLWYRAPELLLGATDYGPAIDLWSAGCILAELFAGKPIMPGRTEVEQMHKIFKLCGSPSEGFWRRTKLPLATSFKPQQPYKRLLAETFRDFPTSALALVDKLLAIEPENRGSASSALKSEFFTTEPLPCSPSSLPKFPPSKEFDAKLRDEEARRRRAESVRGRGAESVRGDTRDTKAIAEIKLGQNTKGSNKLNPQEGFTVEDPRGATQSSYSHSKSMVHPTAVGRLWSKKPKPSQRHHMPQALAAAELSRASHSRDEKTSGAGYVSNKRIHYSGPLVPHGGNMEDMLKEHERQIQQAVRKARDEKARVR